MCTTRFGSKKALLCLEDRGRNTLQKLKARLPWKHRFYKALCYQKKTTMCSEMARAMTRESFCHSDWQNVNQLWFNQLAATTNEKQFDMTLLRHEKRHSRFYIKHSTLNIKYSFCFLYGIWTLLILTYKTVTTILFFFFPIGIDPAGWSKRSDVGKLLQPVCRKHFLQRSDAQC